jgi:hypothetical protein
VDLHLAREAIVRVSSYLIEERPPEGLRLRLSGTHSAKGDLGMRRRPSTCLLWRVTIGR